MSNAVVARQIAELESREDLTPVEVRRLHQLVDGEPRYGKPRPKWDERHRMRGL